MGFRMVLPLIICSMVFAQRSVATDDNIAQALSRMKDSDALVRYQGLDDLLTTMSDAVGSDGQTDRQSSDLLSTYLKKYPTQADSVKMALISQLIADNGDIAAFTSGARPAAQVSQDSASREIAESVSEHYASLIQMVASLDDARAIPALLGALTTGHMATDALVKYGQQALGPLLALLNDQKASVRWIATDTAIQILAVNSEPSSHAQIANLLGRAIADRDSLVRMLAVDKVGRLPARDRGQFVPALRQLAQQDPFTVQDSKGVVRYTIRLQAQKILDEMARQ